MQRNLEGRFAVATGATRGIGRAIAPRLWLAGARVLGTGSTGSGAAPAGCEYRAVDLADEGATAAFAEFVAWLGGPDNTFISGQNIAIDGGHTRT